MVGLVVRMPASPNAPATGAAAWFRWPNDTVLRTADNRHEVRLAASAVAEMRAEARRGARVRAPQVETGGSLLGGFDAAASVVWVDEATGPPSDSLLSEVHFQHGTMGVEERIAARRTATARVTTFVGMWHTHPYGLAAPSPTDEEGMQELVLPVAKAPPRALLLIAGGQSQRWRAWLAGDAAPDWYARVVERVNGDTAQVVARLVGCGGGLGATQPEAWATKGRGSVRQQVVGGGGDGGANTAREREDHRACPVRRRFAGGSVPPRLPACPP
jgi:integrative and conjugative element protein (TIGR02256 family)